MKRTNKKAFTLIELIAVLVILSIVMMIVTPLVLNIIRKARVSADRRSIDAYARSVEIGVATYLLDNLDFPKDFSDIKVEYRGDEVKCANIAVNYDGSIYLDKCTVNGRIAKDSKALSGYYTVGYASSNYLFYNIQDIEIENIDHNINGTGTVNGGLSVNGTINYNGVLYYEIPSITLTGNLKLLVKATPLTYEEVVRFNGSANNVDNLNGVGLVAFYESDTCNINDTSGCTADYESSLIKKIVDAYAKSKSGSDYRLITIDELVKAGFVVNGGSVDITSSVDSLFKVDIPYWTMSKVEGSNTLVYSGALKFTGNFVYTKAAVRPIIAIDAKKLDELKQPKVKNITQQPTKDTATNPYTVDKIIMFVALIIVVICLIVLFIYLLIKNNEQDKNKTKEAKNK